MSRFINNLVCIFDMHQILINAINISECLKDFMLCNACHIELLHLNLLHCIYIFFDCTSWIPCKQASIKYTRTMRYQIDEVSYERAYYALVLDLDSFPFYWRQHIHLYVYQNDWIKVWNCKHKASLSNWIPHMPWINCRIQSTLR